MAFHQTISGELLASPDFRDGGSRTVRRAVSNLEAMYTPMARTLRQTESDLGQSTARSMSSPSSSPMFGLNNRGSSIQGASSLFDDLNGLERAAIQGLGLQTDFENCRRPVFNSHSAPGNDLRASFVAQDNNNMRRMPLTRRATDIGPNHADIYEGADVDGGISLHEEEEDACDG